LPSAVFKDGSKVAKEIKQIQLLNAVNYKCVIADGIYGNKTKDTVTRFQKIYLPYEIESIYGSNTKWKLQVVLKSQGF
jgi:peptidoglycan hydrolase-like protein with peptidoglycan-binding domain